MFHLGFAAFFIFVQFIICEILHHDVYCEIVEISKIDIRYVSCVVILRLY